MVHVSQTQSLPLLKTIWLAQHNLTTPVPLPNPNLQTSKPPHPPHPPPKSPRPCPATSTHINSPHTLPPNSHHLSSHPASTSPKTDHPHPYQNLQSPPKSLLPLIHILHPPSSAVHSTPASLPFKDPPTTLIQTLITFTRTDPTQTTFNPTKSKPTLSCFSREPSLHVESCAQPSILEPCVSCRPTPKSKSKSQLRITD